MKKLLNILLFIIGIGITVFAVIMLVSAIRFLELGRVVFYAVIAILAIELAVWGAIKAFKK